MTLFGDRSVLKRVALGARGLIDRPSDFHGRPGDVRVVGHRGAPHCAPENTVKCFEAALDEGADAIETDISVTKDGHVVLWHDNDPDLVSLGRQIGGEDVPFIPRFPALYRRPVWTMTLAELQEECGYTRRSKVFSNVLGEDTEEEAAVETANQLFEWSSRETRLRDLYLDIKLVPDQTREVGVIARSLREAQRRGWLRPELCIHLLLPQVEIYEAFAEEAKNDGMGSLILTPDFELPGVLDVIAGHPEVRHVSIGYTVKRVWGEFARELKDVMGARRDGRLDSVTVWTINDEAQMRAVLDAEVDAILTDDPARLREVLSDARRVG